METQVLCPGLGSKCLKHGSSCNSAILLGRYPPFTAEETETQRSDLLKVTSLATWKVRFQPRQSGTTSTARLRCLFSFQPRKVHVYLLLSETSSRSPSFCISKEHPFSCELCGDRTGRTGENVIDGPFLPLDSQGMHTRGQQ